MLPVSGCRKGCNENICDQEESVHEATPVPKPVQDAVGLSINLFQLSVLQHVRTYVLVVGVGVLLARELSVKASLLFTRNDIVELKLLRLPKLHQGCLVFQLYLLQVQLKVTWLVFREEFDREYRLLYDCVRAIT